MAEQDLRSLSDRELGNAIHDLALRIAVLEAQIEPPAAGRKRTIKLVRSLVLMAGGLIAATAFDLLGMVLTLLGAWDCAEAVTEDAAEMNCQIELQRSITELGIELTLVEDELRRRGGVP